MVFWILIYCYNIIVIDYERQSMHGVSKIQLEGIFPGEIFHDITFNLFARTNFRVIVYGPLLV